jgi:hypothetical protein
MMRSVGASKRSRNRVESCMHDMYRHQAAVTLNDVLTVSGLFLQRFLGMMLGTRERIYWRTFVVFQWLDHREYGYNLGFSVSTELAGRADGASFECYGMRRKRMVYR